MHCSAEQVTREVFEASGGRLKVVGRAGVGVDNVDLTAATEVLLTWFCMQRLLKPPLLQHAASHPGWLRRTHVRSEASRSQDGRLDMQADRDLRQASTVGFTRLPLCTAHACRTAACMTPAVPWPQYGCLVVNAPTANTVAAAEHGIAMLCALSRNVAQARLSHRMLWQPRP